MHRSDLHLKQIGVKALNVEYIWVFIDLEKAYDRVNKEALWQVLRMHDVEGKLLGGIKSLNIDSLVCIRVKEGVWEQFRIDNGVRRLHHVLLALQCIDGCSDETHEDGDGKGGRE